MKPTVLSYNCAFKRILFLEAFMFANFTWKEQSYLGISTNPYRTLKLQHNHQERLRAGEQLGQQDWHKEVLQHVLELKPILTLQIN